MSKIISVLRNNRGFILFLLALFVVRGSIFDWHPVPTGSMKPTILEGDVIVESKIAYDLKLPFSDTTLLRVGEPKRGDIVVFSSEKSGKRLIKRLVGLPGDTIQVTNDQLVINGVYANYKKLPLNDPRIPEKAPDRDNGFYALESAADMDEHVVLIDPTKYNEYRNIPPTVVPEDHYFFMGDNRDNSADSRTYGTSPRSELMGRAFGVMLSVRWLEDYSPRWERFFSSLYQ
ncbi:signal peptidase I [Leucothrix sargassi]|nr:signal peptidase I [Leucothrix sargassi]